MNEQFVTKPHMLKLLLPAVLTWLIAGVCGLAVAQPGRNDSQVHVNERAPKNSKNTADVDLGPYMAGVQRRIQLVWFPPTGGVSRTALVAFQIHSTGTESHLRIEKTSGDEELDAAALLAVNDAAPFERLPEGAPPGLQMRLTLAYNVGPDGRRTKTVVSTQGSQPEQKRPQASPDTKSVDFGPYMADLQRRIKRVWFPPKADRSKRVKVVFKVYKDGRVSHLKVLKSSGVAKADVAALKAVEKAAPFWDLPEGAPSDVDIEFTFDYNVFGGADTADGNKDANESASATKPANPTAPANAASPATRETSSKSPLTLMGEGLLGVIALAGCFLPSILNFKRNKKKRKQWLVVNGLIAVVFLFVPDMLAMNVYIGTPILVVTTMIWLLMLVDSMSDDRD